MIFCININVEFNLGRNFIDFCEENDVLYEVEVQNTNIFELQDTSDYTKRSPKIIVPNFFTIKVYGSIKKILNILLYLSDKTKGKFIVEFEIPSGINLEYYTDILPKNLDYNISTNAIIALKIICEGGMLWKL